MIPIDFKVKDQGHGQMWKYGRMLYFEFPFFRSYYPFTLTQYTWLKSAHMSHIHVDELDILIKSWIYTTETTYNETKNLTLVFIPLCATIFLQTMVACWHRSLQFNTCNQNDFSVKNQIEHTG